MDLFAAFQIHQCYYTIGVCMLTQQMDIRQNVGQKRAEVFNSE